MFRNYVLGFAAFAISALACSATAVAMGTVPANVQAEAAAEQVIPQTELVAVRIAEQTIREARAKGASTDAEIKATAKLHDVATKAVYEAVRLRLALDRVGFDKQAKIVFAKKAEACAILSGC